MDDETRNYVLDQLRVLRQRLAKQEEEIKALRAQVAKLMPGEGGAPNAQAQRDAAPPTESRTRRGLGAPGLPF